MQDYKYWKWYIRDKEQAAKSLFNFLNFANQKSSCKWKVYSDCSRPCLLIEGAVEDATVMYYHIFPGNRIRIVEEEGCMKIAILDS